MVKKWLQCFVVALLLVWVYPAFVLSFIPAEDYQRPTQEPTIPSTSLSYECGNDDRLITLLSDGDYLSIKLDTYLTGVLLAEIPGDFHFEAKKAQAVVARTYTIKTISDGYKHGKGIICSDSGCCQAYISADEFLARWGSEEVLNLAREAVRETADEIICYGDELIDATYFSCSGGMTENAVAVWGTDVPYLQSVDSPGEEQAAAYVKTLRYTIDEFCSLLSLDSNDFRRYGIGSLTYTEGNGVKTIELGGKMYDGHDLRMRLQLPSTMFSITEVGNHVIITTKGFGHRVGLSQYGADAMARTGAHYIEIIQHYYQGVQVKPYTSEEH